MPRDLLSQHHELRQEQILAPRQIQSLEVLLTPLLELQEKLSQEIASNPVIEADKNPIEELSGDPMRSASNAADAADASNKEDENDISDLLKLADSWHDNLPPIHSRNYASAEDDEKREFMFNSLIEQPSLQEHLLEQLRFADADTKTTEIAETVIGSIDNSGYLKTHPADIAIATASSMEDVEKAVELVQSFEPAGIGARDLKECLLLQLKRTRGNNRMLKELISEHLEDLGRNRMPQIARAMKCSVEKVEELTRKIRSLNPFPGSSMAPSDPVYIIPELTVEKIDGKYVISSSDNYLPRLKISQTYLDLLEKPDTPTDTKNYIKEKLINAKMLLKSLDQRQSTIRRIAQVIVDTQYDFFEEGVEHLRPLTMQQVADKLGLHETTISRAIANKYLKTPNGLYEFKFFFTTGYQSASGEEISSRGIKEKIKDLIADENPQKPLSDNKLSSLLKKDGLNVARRTVAKYREELGIVSSSMRRKFS
ncbi:RNA polymerase factor sigma-54 [Lentisphaerota bacterium ZTH]|nr:RNA polymerase factor sigma-54 [Lentisphaerota bacterium]WET07351.1 RNA polymerase factor sigma-54 [Lentisphaerota bacterium ZTH]